MDFNQRNGFIIVRNKQTEKVRKHNGYTRKCGSWVKNDSKKRRCVDFIKFYFYQPKCFQLALRYCAIIVCTVAFFYQASLLVDKYMQRISVMKTTFSFNESLHFPAITLCPDTLEKNPMIHNFSANSSKTGIIKIKEIFQKYSPEEIWNDNKIYISNVSIRLHKSFSLVDGDFVDDFPFESSKIISPTGVCTTFFNDKPIYHVNKNTFLDIKISHFCSDCRIQVGIHSYEDKEEGKYFGLLFGYRMHLDNSAEFYFNIREIKLLNRSSKPCSTSQELSACFQRCIENNLYTKIKSPCQLPFMEGRRFSSVCKTPETIYRMYNHSDRIFRNWNLKDCNCPSDCYHIFYDLQYVNYFSAEEESIQLRIHFNPIIITEKEIVAYSLYNLLSDVGGTMGLYLGICILTLVDFIEGCFHYVKTFLRGKQKFFKCFLNDVNANTISTE